MQPQKYHPTVYPLALLYIMKATVFLFGGLCIVTFLHDSSQQAF